jgi:hypothetical protein
MTNEGFRMQTWYLPIMTPPLKGGIMRFEAYDNIGPASWQKELAASSWISKHRFALQHEGSAFRIPFVTTLIINRDCSLFEDGESGMGE